MAASLGDDDGASPVVSFIAGAVVLSLSFASVVAFTRTNELGTSDPDASDLRLKASSTLDLILTSPGLTAGGATNWETSLSDVTRLGLANATKPNFLDYGKIQALRQGNLTASKNDGVVDYPEAKAALAMNGYDFHMRTYPVLISMSDAKWSQYRGYRVAYLGHFDSSSAVSAAVDVSTSRPGAYTDIAVQVAYSSGPTPNVFQVTYDVDTTASHNVQNFYTPAITPGQSATVHARIFDLDWKKGTGNYKLRVTVTDAATSTKLYDNSLLQAPLTRGLANQYDIMIEPTRTYYTSGNAVLTLDKFAKDGARWKNASVAAQISITDPTGTVIVNNAAVTIPKSNTGSYTLSLTGLADGAYTGTLTAGTEVMPFTFVKHATLPSTSYAPTPENMKERGYVTQLFSGFVNTTYFTDPNGNVFRDHRDDTGPLGDTLLASYNVLIVGTNITSNALEGSFKNKVADWVNGGGTLIALGSDDKNVQWMNAVFGAGVSTASGGISTPDPTSPVLHVPEELNYQTYNDFGYTYKIKGSDADKFTHIIVKAQSGGQDAQDTLAISDPGAYGDGAVIVTSYIPSAMAGNNPTEAAHFLHNLVTQSFQMLFIDYGPPIPSKATVASSTRLAVATLPTTPDALVDVKVVMYVFH